MTCLNAEISHALKADAVATQREGEDHAHGRKAKKDKKARQHVCQYDDWEWKKLKKHSLRNSKLAAARQQPVTKDREVPQVEEANKNRELCHPGNHTGSRTEDSAVICNTIDKALHKIDKDQGGVNPTRRLTWQRSGKIL